jgi:hypothetical protein
MVTTEAFTVRTDPNIVHQLDHMAESLDQSRNYLVNQSLCEYLKTHTQTVEKVPQAASSEDFFNCAGIWEDHEIDQAALRSKAWPDQNG